MSAQHSQRSWLRRLLAGPASEFAGDSVHLRRWFVAFLAWMSLLTFVAATAFEQYAEGDEAARGLWLLSLGLFYLSLCCLFFPAPTAWIIMLLASNEMAILEPASARVLIVSALGAAATGIANLNEYHLITFLLRYGQIGRVRQTRVYRWAARWFGVSPFVVIAVFGFLPLPVDVVRWLAIMYRYSRPRYFAAYVVGRFPRYVIWSLSAVWLDLTWWQILMFQAVLVLVAALLVLRSALQKRRVRRLAAPDLAATGRMT